MKRYIYSMVPIVGVLALSFPVSAAAPGAMSATSMPGSVSSDQPLLIAEGRGAGGGGGPAAGGGGGPAAGGGGGPAAGGGGGAGRSAGGGGGGARSMSHGSSSRSMGDRSGGNRSTSERSNRSSGDRGSQKAVRTRDADGSAKAVNRDRGDRDRGNVRTGRDRSGDRWEHRGQRFAWGSGFEFWFYDGYYHGNCNWLRERYRETGESYWLRRFRQCRDY